MDLGHLTVPRVFLEWSCFLSWPALVPIHFHVSRIHMASSIDKILHKNLEGSKELIFLLFILPLFICFANQKPCSSKLTTQYAESKSANQFHGPIISFLPVTSLQVMRFSKNSRVFIIILIILFPLSSHSIFCTCHLAVLRSIWIVLMLHLYLG